MKKTVIFLLLFFTTIIVQAQVGINTTIPNAQLDIRSSNQATPTNTDGILIPKVDAFPATNPTAAQQGMLVYLTTTSGTDLPGFYYWDNATVDWIPIGSSNNSWTTTGNAGTNATTNFIGTKDDNNLIFKRNNLTAGMISYGNFSFGYNNFNSGMTGSENYLYGSACLSNNVSGSYNIALGTFALHDNTIGGYNVAIGRGSNERNTSGFSNVTIGAYSGNNNTGGNYNVAVGRLAAYQNTNGYSNTGIGDQALYTNSTGYRNTAIGADADVVSSNLNNATAIGARALVGNSNSLVLGSINGVNGATSSVNVGIGTTTPSERLHVVGNLRMVDGNQAAGRVLTCDGNGTATWQNASANTWGLIGNSATNPSTNFIGTFDNQSLAIRTNNTERIRVSNTGDVGIGTSTPAVSFEIRKPDPIVRIAADDTNSSFLQLYEMTAGLPYGYMFEYDGNLDKLYLHSKGFAGNDGIRMTWLKTGNVGIGTLNPNGQFELSLDQGRKPGTNTWTIVSDQRLKTINGNYTKGLNEILQLNPIRFNYKNNGERTFEKEILDTEFAGFIAQEVQPLFPDAVGTDPDGFLNFNIHPIFIASVNAIKELNSKNQSLEEENQQLKQQLESLLAQQQNQESLNKAIVERLAALETKN
ncbi:MAG: tail fiber domain-containing protein [Flavobacteriales bacterium]|nr:tail fiber domain-containing protein [Flavobacteriales bacterium]